MKQFIKNDYFKYYIVILLSLFIEEMIFKGISGLPINLSILRIFASVNIFAAIISFILNFIPKKWIKKIIVGFISFVGAFYATLQMGFNNFLGVYISFQTSSQLGAVKDYIKDFFKSFKIYYSLPFTVFLLVLIYLIFFDKKKSEKLRLKFNSVFSSMLLIFFSSIYMASLITPVFQNKLQAITNKELFLTASNPTLTAEQYGIVGFGILDVKAMLFPVVIEEKYEVNNQELSSVNEYTRVIDDEAWKMVIENEKNDTYNSLNKYFISRNITDKNDYTGMFEDKNLIVIMMESVNDIFIDPDYYPNFYKMVNEGWYFENNYSPRNSCATMNNEFSGMTSLYSIYNTCTASKYKSNKYYESLFNLFNDEDYVTFSAHNYTQAYYPRKTIHRNMGSGQYYGVEKLGISYSNEYRNWSDDDDFMKKVLKIIDKKTDGKKNKRFMTWLTTVSSHQPYSSDSIQGNRYYKMTRDTHYPSDVRRFMSKLKILDNGLGILLDGLKKRGMLDDTVIVLYGDHYPYGISKSHLNRALDYNAKEDLNAERVPFVIYNSKIEGDVFPQYTSYLNIVPTLANLFGIDYDPRLYLGEDLFSSDYQSLTVFADGSWKNERAFYSAPKSRIKYYTSEEYTPEEIMNINNMINEKVSISNKVIKNNYFSYLKRNLDKAQKEINDSRGNICLNNEKSKYES